MDRARARDLSAKIEEVADRIIAHHDRKRTQATVTFDELRDSIHAFDELVVKYRRFLTGAGSARETLAAANQSRFAEVFRYLVKP
jgi:hypothetical protein